MVAVEQLCALVRTAAQQELLSRYRRVRASAKVDGSLITEADIAMQERLQGELARAWPRYRLLGEEMDSQRQAELLADVGAGIWVLDPLDGTINFASGVPVFAVSLALLDRSGVAAGVIYDPLRDECFSAARGQGARLNGDSLTARCEAGRLAECVAEVDLKRLTPALRGRIAEQQPFRSQRNFGSGALDWAWLAAGRVQLYLHGGQKLWDYAAGSLILAEAGGRASDLAGKPVLDWSLTPRPVVAATDSGLFEQWLGWCTESRPSSVG